MFRVGGRGEASPKDIDFRPILLLLVHGSQEGEGRGRDAVGWRGTGGGGRERGGKILFPLLHCRSLLLFFSLFLPFPIFCLFDEVNCCWERCWREGGELLSRKPNMGVEVRR